MHLSFLHTEVTCERTFQMQACDIENESFFTHFFLKVHQGHKSGWLSLKISSIVTASLGMMMCENDTDATKN